MNRMVARLDDAEGGSQRIGIEALGEIDAPPGVVVIALVTCAIPGDPNCARNWPGCDPWHEFDSCVYVCRIINFHRGLPRGAVVTWTEDEDNITVGVTEIDWVGRGAGVSHSHGDENIRRIDRRWDRLRESVSERWKSGRRRYTDC